MTAEASMEGREEVRKRWERKRVKEGERKAMKRKGAKIARPDCVDEGVEKKNKKTRKKKKTGNKTETG